MDFFYGKDIDVLSPALIASKINMPVMLIHGENDQRFPVSNAHALKNSFKHGQADIYVAPGAGHSGSSQTEGYMPAVKDFLESNMVTLRKDLEAKTGACRL